MTPIQSGVLMPLPFRPRAPALLALPSPPACPTTAHFSEPQFAGPCHTSKQGSDCAFGLCKASPFYPSVHAPLPWSLLCSVPSANWAAFPPGVFHETNPMGYFAKKKKKIHSEK